MGPEDKNQKVQITLKMMKIVFYVCMGATISASFRLNSRHKIVEPEIEYFDYSESSQNSCQNFMDNINRDIRRQKEDSDWTRIRTAMGDHLYQKKKCKHQTFDMMFCTMVCQLDLGQWCPTNPGVGEDVCDFGLFCSPNSNRCESMDTDYSFDFSSDY